MARKVAVVTGQPKLSEVTISCACGHKIKVSSAVAAYTIEICSNCHPFFTGKQKFIDAAGKIDKFNKKYEKFVSSKKPAAQPAA